MLKNELTIQKMLILKPMLMKLKILLTKLMEQAVKSIKLNWLNTVKKL